MGCLRGDGRLLSWRCNCKTQASGRLVDNAAIREQGRATSDRSSSRSFDPPSTYQTKVSRVSTPYVMAKGNYRTGVSRQVRKVQIVTDSNCTSDISRRASGERISSLLGFRARAAEEARIKERVQEQYAGTYTTLSIYSNFLTTCSVSFG